MKYAINYLMILISVLSMGFNSLYSLDKRGFYNPVFGYISCEGRGACIHEVGHKMDHSLGWISNSMDYEVTVRAYLLYNWRISPELRDPMAEQISFFPGFFTPIREESNFLEIGYWTGGWGGNVELYASMFKWADGKKENMPEPFRKFYDWNMAEELINQYARQTE